ncbi:MAG: D-alanyl-D-alanine carboxypeptidase family protein [Chloroflexota bacterium]
MNNFHGRELALLSLLVFTTLLASCASGEGQAAQKAQDSPTTVQLTPVITGEPTTIATPATEAAVEVPHTPTTVPTSTALPTMTAPPVRPTPTMTMTPIACDQRSPPDSDLLTLVSRDYGLSREYEPGDLVPLSDYFPTTVTLGYPTEVRQVLVEPLQAIINAMQAEGLRPQIISGYRSYSAQTMALQKWLEQYPDWADRLSAPPGHSEHQLGTTVDFGSPELAEMLDEAFIQFHPAFDQTSEGEWLHENAYRYGFVLSYPEGAYERTGFYYEPWHFRYVGVELATQLHQEQLTISEYLLESRPAPCVP